jgi:hypothetical protein
VEKKKVIIELKNRVEGFLENVAQKEEQGFRVRAKISQLEDIVYGRRKEYWSVEQRYANLETWFSQEGQELLKKHLSRDQLEKIIACVEKMKEYRGDLASKEENQAEKEMADRILRRSNAFIRDSTRRLGLEYTPLGLVDMAQVEEDKLKLMGGIRSSLPKGDTLKLEYQRLLGYQNQMLEFFYKPQEHLLTILDYQLRALEVRYSEEDEFFTTCLINFMRLRNYRIAPYIERFKKIISARQKQKEE